MKTWTVDALQGSDEWKAHRNNPNTFNASELACAMGIDPNGRKRSDLVRRYATGIEIEFSDYVQDHVIAPGHDIEAFARAVIERRIGASFFPEVIAGEVDGLIMSASLDGITMERSMTLECKRSNASLRAAVAQNIIPDGYKPQMEQGLWLSDADVCLFTISDGLTEEGTISVEYRSDPELRAKIIPTWRQFAEDVRNYNPASMTAEEAVTGRAPDLLPALHIEVTGMVTASNLAQFKETALAVFRGINTNLQTDQDFADAEKAVKFCKDAEERLDAAKSHALSQTASIDELFRTIDGIKDEAKAVRLKLDKLVKAEKENRKIEIVTQARGELEAHIQALNKRIGGQWMPYAVDSRFADSVKGLKSLDSMRDKIATTMANAKIEANAIADRIQINKDSLTSHDWPLVPDFAAICTKEPGDFAAVVAMRAQKRKEDEELRMEAERARIRAEEQAKAEREAQDKAKVEQAERDMEAARARAADRDKLEQERVQLQAEADKARLKREEDDKRQAAEQAAQIKAQFTQRAANNPVITPEEKRVAVIEHQDEIAAFMSSRDWGKDAGKIRAVLVEFVKFTADRERKDV